MAKILLACHQFYPRYYTGTEILVLEVADELRERGYKVAILTTEPLIQGDELPESPLVKEEQYNGHQVWKIIAPNHTNILQRLEHESYDDRVLQIYNNVLEEFQPDICHIFHLMRLTSFFVDILEEKGIKKYFTSTDYWFLCPTYQLIRYNDKLCQGPEPSKCFVCLANLYTQGMETVPLHYKAAYKLPKLASLVNKEAAKMQKALGKRIEIHKQTIGKFDGVFISNLFMQSLFHKNGLKGKKEYIMDFPVPTRAEGVSNIDNISEEGSLRVGFIGTLRPSKGPHVLINACNELRDVNNIEVEIWGEALDKQYKQQLNDAAEGIEFVNFCGTFIQEDFNKVLEKLDVVVIPSIWYENTPLTALTALLGKRVLIVSNLGGLSTLVQDNVSGFTFPVGDSVALSKILKKLAQDRHKLVTVAKSIPNVKTTKTYVNRLIETYEG